MQKINALGVLFILALMVQCKEDKKSVDKVESSAPLTEVAESVVDTTPILIEKPENIKAPDGMVWIPGGEFIQGAVPQDKMAMDHEKPAHKVKVNGFFMDVTEVTNAQFAKFVKETGYVTVAERAIDWEEMKTQVPEGTPKPHDSILQPGSLTFKKTKTSVPNLYDFSQWWNWTIGANWKQPNGPGSSIKGKDNEPVVQVAYEDALAYCEFPVTNSKADGYEQRAKVKSYPPNDFGLYDMAGNVWEWTSDWYNTNYYKELGALNGPVVNPQGAATPYNPNMPYAKEKVMRGGSFLCNASYCASYRISSRMASSLDSSLEHLGFRTVATVDMLTKEE